MVIQCDKYVLLSLCLCSVEHSTKVSGCSGYFRKPHRPSMWLQEISWVALICTDMLFISHLVWWIDRLNLIWHIHFFSICIYCILIHTFCCISHLLYGKKYFFIWNVFRIADINHSTQKPTVEYLYIGNLNMLNIIQGQLFRQPILVWWIQVSLDSENELHMLVWTVTLYLVMLNKFRVNDIMTEYKQIVLCNFYHAPWYLGISYKQWLA